MSGYSSLSVNLTHKLKKDVKKNNGIFFTPPSTVRSVLHNIKQIGIPIRNALEPSCGSCEFVTELSRMYPDAAITAIENNVDIYDDVKHLQTHNITIHNLDFLRWRSETKYDLIIGNPPYFVMKKSDVETSYLEYFEGRPNIFMLFVIKSLGLLASGGILSFVLPTSFLNCTYYQKLREHINVSYEIVDITECRDKYIETKQDTVMVTIRNTKGDNSRYMYRCAFCVPENAKILSELTRNSTTLDALGFDVYVGKVVWNQCKDILTDDSAKTLLIYSSDINDGNLEPRKYSNPLKKNYINKPGDTSKILVMNRGYGVGTYKFEYCLIEGGFEYLVENHLICIKARSENMENGYSQIMRSFEDDRTARFIRTYFGNSAMNTYEIKNILPIFSY